MMVPLLLALLLVQDFIDLQVALPVPLPGGGIWQANAPLVDLLGLALLPFALRVRPVRPPGGWGALAFLGVALISTSRSAAPLSSLHYLVREPVFLYVIYGLGLATLVARAVPPGTLQRGLLAWAATTATISVLSSVVRIAQGDALWFAPVPGLTANHKTLAVALAGALPLILSLRDKRPRGVALLATVAILLSGSKTAWITTAFAWAWFYPRHNPPSRRWRLALPALALALGLAVFLPVALHSAPLLDAARSRQSLNLRAWQMFTARPLTGQGPGASTSWPMQGEHERIVGVDDHGVVQKIGAETGLLGLAAYGWFSLSTLAALRRRGHTGALATWATLHLDLLLSTETFSPTHWVPLAIAWGLAHREEPP